LILANHWAAWVKICEEIKKAVTPSPEPPPPDGEPAVSGILSRCYRRALFTRMHAQIDEKAMFASIDDCRKIIQANIPHIRSETLQGNAVELLAVIDEILRRDPIQSSTDTEDINKLKLRALNAFRELARVTGGSYPLPEPGKLAEGIYFTPEEADQPPSIEEIRHGIRP
jgi:hypothetical protein